MLIHDAAFREERLQKDAQVQCSNTFAREEVLLQTRAVAEQRNLTREKAYIDDKLKRKRRSRRPMKLKNMRTQISHIEVMERWEAKFVVDRAKEKEIVTKEMQACMQLER